MSEISYSLFIPTRNRPGPVECLIRHVLEFFPENFEVVVQDCGPQGQLPAALGDVIGDPRLRYEHTGRLVSMTDNWNQGIARCRGEYVSILGDDDAVTRELPVIVDWMRARNMDVLVNTTKRVFYHWPSFPDAAKAGTYEVYRYSGELVEYDSAYLLDEQVRTFGYAEVRVVPQVYQGILRRRYLDQIRARTGTWFQGFTPDLFINYFLINLVPRTCWVDYPIFLPGSCASSNSADGLTGQPIHPHTKEFTGVEWPAVIPEGSMYQLLVAEGMVRGLLTAGREDLVRKIKWPDFYLISLLHDRAYRRRNLLRYWQTSGRFLYPSPVDRLAQMGVGFVRRLYGKLKQRHGYLEPRAAPPPRELFETFSGVSNTTELIDRLEQALVRQAVTPPWARSAGPEAHVQPLPPGSVSSSGTNQSAPA